MTMISGDIFAILHDYALGLATSGRSQSSYGAIRPGIMQLYRKHHSGDFVDRLLSSQNPRGIGVALGADAEIYYRFYTWGITWHGEYDSTRLLSHHFFANPRNSFESLLPHLFPTDRLISQNKWEAFTVCLMRHPPFKVYASRRSEDFGIDQLQWTAVLREFERRIRPEWSGWFAEWDTA